MQFETRAADMIKWSSKDSPFWDDACFCYGSLNIQLIYHTISFIGQATLRIPLNI